MVGGGLLQLVAYGAQDIYLTGNINYSYNKKIKITKIPSFDNPRWSSSTNSLNKSSNIWDSECRKLGKDAKNDICPISFCEIKEKSEYIYCTQCNYNFLKEPIQKALSYSNTCPLCRTEWKNYIVSYNC